MNIKNDDEFLGVKGVYFFDHLDLEVPYSSEMERVYLWAAAHDPSITKIERIEPDKVIDRRDPEAVFPNFLVTRPYKKQIVVLVQGGRITKKMVKAMDEINIYAKSLGGEVIFVRPQDCSFEDEDSFRASYRTDESEEIIN